MLGLGLNPQKRIAELGEREILALAITLEEDDGRIYRDFAEGLREAYPASAKVFDGMAEEESGHRRMLIDLFRERFGEHIPLVRREDVRGFVRRKPIWLTQPLGLDAVRRRAEELEQEAANFYREAAKQVSDATFAELKKHYSARQITDLTLLTAYYLTLGSTINAFRIELEPHYTAKMKPVD